MKRIVSNLLAVCAVIFALTSCGSGVKSQEKNITASSINIEGDSAEYISVPNGTYSLIGKAVDGNTKVSMSIKIKLERKVHLKNLKFAFLHGFDLDILDEAGSSLSTTLNMNDSELNKLKRFLLTGNVGEEQEFTFEDTSVSEKDYKELFEKAGGFELRYVDFDFDDSPEPNYDSETTSLSEEGTEEESVDENTEESSDKEETSDNSGSTDYDELLTAYENYYNKYISMLKKVSKGDLSSMQEATELMQEANQLGEKMANAKGEMSVAQWARYQKIQLKLIKAAQEIK